MNSSKKTWFIPTLLTIIILVAGGFYTNNLIHNKEPMSIQDIQKQLESMYGSTVDGISKEGSIYKAELTRSGATYLAEIDAVTGSVLSLSQTSEVKKEIPQVLSEDQLKQMIAGKYSGEVDRISLDTSGKTPVYEVKLSKNPEFSKVTVDAITGNIVSETKKEAPSKSALISRKEAIAIALTQVKDEDIEEVDDVSYEKTADGGYYLIEIDTKDSREATVQIHAISGKIMSITWEED